MNLIRRKSIFAQSDCSGDLWAVNETIVSAETDEWTNPYHYEYGFLQCAESLISLLQDENERVKISQMVKIIRFLKCQIFDRGLLRLTAS